MSDPVTMATERIRQVMAAGACDLHVHTTASDGTVTPDGLVRLVIGHRLRAFAVTDHDTVASVPGIRQALEGLAGTGKPVSLPVFIPGVELSADYETTPARMAEIHLLGYFPLGGIEAVEAWLAGQRIRRRERNQRMCARLTALGMPITLEELEAEGTGPETENGEEGMSGSVVGRVQTANILVRKGFAVNRRDAFERYLNPGRPGYAERDRLGLREAIGLLLSYGGVPVIAHPHVYGWTGAATGLQGRKLGDVLGQLKSWGLAGVEAFHGEAAESAMAEVAAAGQAAGLLLTGGSDFHGSNRHAALYDDRTDFSRYLASGRA